MNKTFGIIKPEAVKANNIGNILAVVETAGFVITNLKMLKLSKERAEEFYAVHKERPFYIDLVSYMCSGAVVVFSLHFENGGAVDAYRKLIGATNPEEAAEGTIRKLYGTSKAENAVHGSDSDKNAQEEINFFFPS